MLLLKCNTFKIIWSPEDSLRGWDWAREPPLQRTPETRSRCCNGSSNGGVWWQSRHSSQEDAAVSQRLKRFCWIKFSSIFYLTRTGFPANVGAMDVHRSITSLSGQCCLNPPQQSLQKIGEMLILCRGRKTRLCLSVFGASHRGAGHSVRCVLEWGQMVAAVISC